MVPDDVEEQIRPKLVDLFVEFFNDQDFGPAGCNLMGDPVGGELPLDGRDFLDESTTPPEKVITGWSKHVSVRSKKWNMVIDFTGAEDGKRELFDLQADPDESDNVYEKRPDVVKEFTGFLESTLGPLPYEIKHTGDNRQAPPLWWRFRKQ